MIQPARLLFVDDDDANRQLLARRLVRRGYLVDLAEDGPSALAGIARESYDLILLDHMMPGMTGLEVLERLRATRPATELPVIMVTAIGDSEHIVAALRAGANDYVTKPIDFPVLVDRIRAALEATAALRERRRTSELYRLALRSSDAGLWEWDLIGGAVYYSSGWKSMLGLDQADLASDPAEWFTRIHPEDRARVTAALDRYLAAAGAPAPFESQYRMRCGNGEYIWIANRAAAERDPSGRAVHLAGCHTAIPHGHSIDAPTSLPNRAWILDELSSLVEAGRPAALVLVELDGSARIQENLADVDPPLIHLALAARLRAFLATASAAPGAVLALSGDWQFTVLLPEAALDQAHALALHLQHAFAEPIQIGRHSLFATASLGIAAGDGAASPADLLRDAHAALRYAHEHGAHHCEVFQTFMRRDGLAEMRLDYDLHRAVERDEFVVYYQPKIDLARYVVSGCEALVRWLRPGHGLIAPGLFIPAAERTGLISPLGRFVLDRACRDLAAVRRAFPAVRVSVNVSGRQFAEPDLVDFIADCLGRAGLPAEALRLEVTETFLVENPDAALATLLRLRDLGVGLKLDDFGAGYASLDYLQRFPFDSLKIDRSFVSGLPDQRESFEIVRAIIGLANSLHMDMVAEGIEQRDQLDCLRELGCRHGQGFWFAPPLELERFRSFLEGWSRNADPVGRSASVSPAETACV